jgi:hypothetical protein
MLKTDHLLEGSTKSWFDQEIARYEFPAAPITSIPAHLKRHSLVFGILTQAPDRHQHTRTVVPHHRELHRSSELAIFGV